MKDTILMDLDGTLLPMDQETFIQNYTPRLVKRFIQYGYDKSMFIEAVWSGVSAMVKNDGAMMNRERFWSEFTRLLGEEIRDLEPEFEDFYKNEFDHVKSIVKMTSASRKLLDHLHEKGYTTVLATNPLFPKVSVATRLSWIGLHIDDFNHVTTYENSHYCKPNLNYYREILEKIGKEPNQCIMIGNNVQEDMCAQQLGIGVYLITDFLENEGNVDISCYQKGSLEQFIEKAMA